MTFTAVFLWAKGCIPARILNDIAQIDVAVIALFWGLSQW